MMVPSENSLRIGWVGKLDRGGTGYSRLLALLSLEPNVSTLDTNEFLDPRQMSRLERWLESMPGGGRRSEALNQRLLEFTRDNKLNVLWIDKGSWTRPATLRWLRSHGVVLIHHVTDALWPRHLMIRITRLALTAGCRYYHFYLTSNEVDHRRLQSRVQGKVLLTQLGFDDRRFDAQPIHDEAVRQEWSNDTVFIGHHEPRTERFVAALLHAGLPVKVYGANWPRRTRNNPLWRGHAFAPVGDDEYVWALKLAKIGLCFVSEWNYNQTSGRSYEIPASGTFLLAMRTEMHSAHFKEGIEAEFFASTSELVQKASHYLGDERLRARVAHAGYERCMASGYSWQEIMARDWKKIKEAMAINSGPTLGR